MTAAVEDRSRAVEVIHRPLAAHRTPPTIKGKSVYAIGDVHGCYDLLVALLQAIAADAEGSGTGAPLIVFCGDYVDRGPESAKVLSTLVWLSRHATLDVAFLRGNHEEMMLAFLEEPDRNRAWLRFGGLETLRAYGVDIAEDDAAPDCAALRDALMDRLPASHWDLLRRLPSKLVHGDYVFVHAGLRPGVALARQSDRDCLWIEEDFLARDHRFEKFVVHGHTWLSDEPVVTPHRMGIDTGAYETGVLTAVRLGGPEVAFLQARAPARAESVEGGR